MSEEVIHTLQITKEQTCEHLILPEHCVKCQGNVLLDNELLAKDVVNSILLPILNEKQQVFTLDMRYVDPNEIDRSYGETYDCPGLFHISQPLIYNEEMKQLRLVFVGSEEAYYGFLCALLFKYGQSTMVAEGMDFGDDNEKLLIEIQKRWHWETDYCIFKRHPEATAFIERDTIYSTTDINEFACGFHKMLELYIGDITHFNTDVEGQVFFESWIHNRDKCEGCSDDGELPRMNFSDCGKDSKCEAYWYYLNDPDSNEKTLKVGSYVRIHLDTYESKKAIYKVIELNLEDKSAIVQSIYPSYPQEELIEDLILLEITEDEIKELKLEWGRQHCE